MMMQTIFPINDRCSSYSKATRFVLPFVCLFSLLANIAHAANCGGAIKCNCGDTLVYSYTMNGDLLSCPGDGLLIGASGIILDCAGHTIEYATFHSGRGIYVNESSLITIKNCNIRKKDGSGGDVSFGIYFRLGTGNNVVNTTINVMGAVSYGIYLNSSFNNVFTDNSIATNGTAVSLYDSSYNSFRNNSIAASLGGVGLERSSANIFRGNNITSTLGIVVHLVHSFRNVFTSNNILGDNGGVEFYSSGNNIFINNNITSTNLEGVEIRFSSNNAFKNNRITSIHADALFLNDWAEHNTFINNDITSIDSTAVSLSRRSVNNTFINNNIVGMQGVYVGQGIDNAFINNNITNIGHYGVFLTESAEHNTFINNNIKGPYNNIALHDSGVSNTFITNPILRILPTEIIVRWKGLFRDLHRDWKLVLLVIGVSIAAAVVLLVMFFFMKRKS